MRFDLSTTRGVSVSSFDIEEMTGRDSLDAAARAIGPVASDGTDPSRRMSAYELNIHHRNQLVAQSISRVNGKEVPRPFTGWEDWSLRTQEFVVAAYHRLNEASVDEVKDFIKAHFDAPRGSSEPTSSGSGSTSPGI